MSQQDKQGRPQGGQQGGYDEQRRQSRGGHGGDGSREPPWRGDRYGNPPRDWDEDFSAGRRENWEPGNHGRQDLGYYGVHGGGGMRRPQDDGRTGAFGLDPGPLRGYDDMAHGRSRHSGEPDADMRQRSEFDPDYLKWRNEQMQSLDDDYRSWRQDRFKKFSDEFSSWRGQRGGTSNPESAGSSGGASSGAGPSSGPKSSK